MKNPFEFVNNYFYNKFLAETVNKKALPYLLNKFVFEKLAYLGKRWLPSVMKLLNKYDLPVKKYTYKPFTDILFDLNQLYVFIENMGFNLSQFINFQPKLTTNLIVEEKYYKSDAYIDNCLAFVLPPIESTNTITPCSITVEPIIDKKYSYNFGKRYGYIDDIFSDNGLYPDTYGLQYNYFDIFKNTVYNFYFESISYIGSEKDIRTKCNYKQVPENFKLNVIIDFENFNDINTINLRYLTIKTKSPKIEKITYIDSEKGLQYINNKYIDIINRDKVNITVVFPTINTNKITITLSQEEGYYIGADLLRFNIINKLTNEKIKTVFFSLDTLFDSFKDLLQNSINPNINIENIYQFFFTKFDSLLNLAINKTKLSLLSDYSKNSKIVFDGIEKIKENNKLFVRKYIGINQIQFFENKYAETGYVITDKIVYKEGIENFIDALDYCGLDITVILDNLTEFKIANGSQLFFNDYYGLGAMFIEHLPTYYRLKINFNEDTYLIGYNYVSRTIS